jgi:POTRA domain, FtsQ-type
MFSIKSDKIELVLKPEPVFDRTAILSILRDYAGDNIFTVSTGDIFEKLSENIRHIASVEKSIQLPDSIRITITSFPASYRAKIWEDTFLLTENGQLITDIVEVEVPTLEIYHLVQDPNLAKSTPISGEDMFNLRKILNAWGKVFGDSLIIENLKLYEQEKELHIIHRWARIIFLLENGENIVSILQKLLDVSAFKIENQIYVDLRIPNRIFSCPKSDRACSENIRNSYE